MPLFESVMLYREPGELGYKPCAAINAINKLLKPKITFGQHALLPFVLRDLPLLVSNDPVNYCSCIGAC